MGFEAPPRDSDAKPRTHTSAAMGTGMVYGSVIYFQMFQTTNQLCIKYEDLVNTSRSEKDCFLRKTHLDSMYNSDQQ